MSIPSVPTKLRIVQGKLVLADGSDPTEYLKSFEFPEDMPVTVVTSSYVQKLEDHLSINFNSAA